MTALKVSPPREAAPALDVAAVIASLPISLVGAKPGERVDLVAVDGGQGWAQRANEALGQQIRGLLIVQPTPIPPSEVPEGSFVPVVVDYRFAANPAVSATAEALSDWPSDALIEVTAIVPDAASLEETLVDQLATLRRIGHPARELSRLVWTHDGFYLNGTTSQGSALLLAAHVTVGAPRSLGFRSLAADRSIELVLPDPSTARPAAVVFTDPSGATTSPTLWETSHRTAWRRLHRVATELRLTNDLVELRADLTVAVQVLPARHLMNSTVRPFPNRSTREDPR